MTCEAERERKIQKSPKKFKGEQSLREIAVDREDTRSDRG